jgi:hypothetical protein
VQALSVGREHAAPARSLQLTPASAWEDAGRHESPRKLAPEGDMDRDGDGDSQGAWEILTPLSRLCSGRAPRIQLASTRSTLRLRGGSASAGLGGAPLLVTNPTFCPTLLPLLSLSLHFSFPPLHLSSMQSMHERLRAALACLDMLCTAGAYSRLIESGDLLCQRSCVCCNHQACAHASQKHLLASKAMPNQNAT